MDNREKKSILQKLVFQLSLTTGYTNSCKNSNINLLFYLLLFKQIITPLLTVSNKESAAKSNVLSKKKAPAHIANTYVDVFLKMLLPICLINDILSVLFFISP